MAVGFTFSANSIGFFNNPNVIVSSSTWVGGNTYLIFVSTTAATTPTDNPTISSGSLTLTKIGTVTGSNNRIICYRFTPSVNTTTGITFTYAENQLNHCWAIYVSNDLTGFTQIGQSSGSGTGTNPSITMPFANPSHTVAVFMNDKNPFGGTAESGWAENYDTGNATPIGNAGYNRNTTTDNTIQVTAASSTWIGFAVQYYGNTRRIYIC